MHSVFLIAYVKVPSFDSPAVDGNSFQHDHISPMRLCCVIGASKLYQRAFICAIDCVQSRIERDYIVVYQPLVLELPHEIELSILCRIAVGTDP